MVELFAKLVDYLQYPFVRYAIIVGTLIALCAALLGVTLVLKRYSYIGDGLAHVAFGSMAVASVLRFTNDMPFVLGVTIVCAVALLHMGRNSHVKGDAVIGMLSVSAMAVGYLLLNVFGSSGNLAGDVCTTLFGSVSILTLSQWDVTLCIVLSLVVIGLYLFFYHKFFAITFDESFAKAVGTNTSGYNLLLAVMIGVIIVLSINLVGSLLITALVVFPATAAMKLFHSFRAVTICAAVLSVVCALVGMVVSILFGTPVGSTIVVMDLLAFGLSTLVARLK
ncbi:metal ABC transporter permease [Bengtsoniella intestinalis]|uniref:metal ABC transporter permease n=1 Tax=Bengtsoniella intestinalis TaxID=3073143 RepID=UPI00391F4BE9